MTITDQIHALLSADPICGGRVTGETVEAIAALVAGWQPIETAPDEGGVIGWVPCAKRGDRIETVRMKGGKPFIVGGEFAFDRSPVTHWIPFPPPPIERGDFGAGEG